MGKLLEGLDGNRFSGLWKIFYVGFFAGADPIWPEWSQPHRALLNRSMDWCHGRRLRFRQDPDLGARERKRTLLRDRTFRRGAVPRACVDSTYTAIRVRGMLAAQGRNGAPPMPAVACVLEYQQVPSVAMFPLDDARTHHRANPIARRRRGSLAGSNLHLRPRAVLLLHAPHSFDPRPRSRGVEDQAWGMSARGSSRTTLWAIRNHRTGYVWSLPLLYLIWGITIVLLYFPCRWYAEFKAGKSDWWLKYF